MYIFVLPSSQTQMTPEMAFQCAFNAFTTQISERISNLVCPLSPHSLFV